MLFQHATLSYLSTHRLFLKFVKEPWYVPYEAAFLQLQLISLVHWWIGGGLISKFRITRGFSSPIQPAPGYAATPLSSTNKDGLPPVTNTLSVFGLSHFGINYRLRCIIPDTSGGKLAAPVPWSSHITHLLPQPIAFAHMTSLRNSRPRGLFQKLLRFFAYSCS